jgi:hypothetical protein
MRSGRPPAKSHEADESAHFETASVPGDVERCEPAPVSATHDVLFQGVDVRRCDACGVELADEADAPEGYRVAGQGVYMWTRGDEVRFEPAPLCASCASAIGMTALARWEIEEEEG